jgi:hypothetical protein
MGLFYREGAWYPLREHMGMNWYSSLRKTSALPAQWWRRYDEHLGKVLPFIFPQKSEHDSQPHLEPEPRLVTSFGEGKGYTIDYGGYEAEFHFSVSCKGHFYFCTVDLSFSDFEADAVATTTVTVARRKTNYLGDGPFYVWVAKETPVKPTPYDIIHTIRQLIESDNPDAGNDDGDDTPSPDETPSPSSYVPSDSPELVGV